MPHPTNVAQLPTFSPANPQDGVAWQNSVRERRARSPPPAPDVSKATSAMPALRPATSSSCPQREPAPDRDRGTGLTLEGKRGADELMRARGQTSQTRPRIEPGIGNTACVTIGAHTVALRPATSQSHRLTRASPELSWRESGLTLEEKREPMS